MSGIAVALVLSLASTIGYATAAVIQQRLAARIDTPLGWLAAMRYPSWWSSAVLNATAAALHVAALRFGPLTLVQPLGMLTLVLALPLGAMLAGRKVSAAEWRGALATIAGLAGLVFVTSTAIDVQALTGREVSAVAATTAAVLLILTLIGMRSAHPGARSLLYGAASGVAFGIGSALAQTVTVEVTTDGLMANAAIATVALAAAGTMLAQASYRYGLAAPLATSTLTNPLAAAAVGMLLLGEQLTPGAFSLALAVVSVVLSGYGIATLAAHAPGSQSSRAEDDIPAHTTNTQPGSRSLTGRPKR